MLSIVIPSLNTRAHLETMLTSLYASELDEPCEVVVADMASTDGTLQMLEDKFPQVSVLRDIPNRGYGAAANAGIAVVSGDHILVCNSDIVFPEGSLQRIVAMLRDTHDKIILGFRLQGTDGRPQLSARRLPGRLALTWMFAEPLRYWPRFRRRFLGHIDPDSLTDTTPVGCVVGAALAAPRSLLERLGGFDESFFMNSEEIDLCHRVWDSGGTVAHVPSVTLVHAGGASCLDSALRLAWLAEGKARYTRKHFGRWVLMAAKGGALVGYLASLALWIGRWMFRRSTLEETGSLAKRYGAALARAWRT